MNVECATVKLSIYRIDLCKYGSFREEIFFLRETLFKPHFSAWSDLFVCLQLCVKYIYFLRIPLPHFSPPPLQKQTVKENLSLLEPFLKAIPCQYAIQGGEIE